MTTMNEAFDIWKLAAGMGMFLFGMFLLEESLKNLSGKTFKKLIRQYTDSRLKAIRSGAIVTAILQSSAVVALMVLAFVGAGVMKMENAIAVMLGSNIGTTSTAWLVAALGFKVNIETFALPFIGIGGLGMIFLSSSPRLVQTCRLLIGFGLLFLGLDYMKDSVDTLARSFDLSYLAGYGLWLYVLFGALITALMQSSSASIAIILTALNSQLISLNMGVAMVIGANIGTTVIVLIGCIGGVQAKKRAGVSHLVFNVITGMLAFATIPFFIWFIQLFIVVDNNSVIALALYHTLFNVMGVVVFYPFIGLLARMLVRMFPDRRTVLTVFIDKTPTEVIEAATDALKEEVKHMLEECQLYNLRMLNIDEKLVFDHDTPFQKNTKLKLTDTNLYDQIKLLHAQIFAYYSKVQSQKMEETEVKISERTIYASRNIMNSIKNFKDIKHNLDDFDISGNEYLNTQYKMFRKRLVRVYHEMNSILQLDSSAEQYRQLLAAFFRNEKDDKRVLGDTMRAVSEKKIHEIEIASLLLVNRLFSQSCRLQIFGLKDLLLSQDQVNDFDRALDMKEIIEQDQPHPEAAGQKDSPAITET
ncbi:MAG: Na/Pi symporter [Desulfobulbaceae bacterium]|nr:Na/Pi symporter [Desulfobulbaceae bacterium]